ncbi:SDR family oxidoreductase [Streptosporangium amethystogenes]|uniref:SDR family oxidoreductase n=1 Tax=Streptosporangium amethystogenes TaxID=2002 RepID=UPI002480CC96|nr:SDR family oxidoreductase [Streptosporangium amethystogenes]
MPEEGSLVSCGPILARREAGNSRSQRHGPHLPGQAASRGGGAPCQYTFHQRLWWVPATSPGLAFAREGAAVVVADVTAGDNEDTIRMIVAQGGRAPAVTCDATGDDDVRVVLDTVIGQFGRIDIAFDDAGVEQPVKPLTELTEASKASTPA